MLQSKTDQLAAYRVKVTQALTCVQGGTMSLMLRREGGLGKLVASWDGLLAEFVAALSAPMPLPPT